MGEDSLPPPTAAEIIASYPLSRNEAELAGVSKSMSIYHLAGMPVPTERAASPMPGKQFGPLRAG